MDLSQLAESLGLPKESAQEKVFSALAIRLAEGDAAKTELASAKQSLSSLSAEHAKLGLRLDQGKLVKVNQVEALDLSIKEGDDEEKIALKTDAIKARLEAQKVQLSTDLAAVEKLSLAGQLTPAVMAPLRKLVSLRGKCEALALSKDGSEITSAPEEARGLVMQMLKAMGELPKLTAPTGLQRLAVVKEDPSKDAEALSNEGKKIAARVAPGKTKSEKEKATAGK